MIIETRFSLGQTVWRIGWREETRVLPCRFCRGAGQLRVDSVNKQSWAYVSCPNCRGHRHVTIGSIPLFELAGSGQVGSIEVRLFELHVQGYNGGRDRKDREERYMLDATGFPSGSVFTNVELYASEHEATEECERRNEEIERGESERWKPSRGLYEEALMFSEHADVYEHDPKDLELAQQIMLAYAFEPEGDHQ